MLIGKLDKKRSGRSKNAYIREHAFWIRLESKEKFLETIGDGKGGENA